MYCSNGDVATVEYTSKSGVKAKFTTKNTPISIDCQDEQRTGRYIFTVRDEGYTSNCQSTGIVYTDTVVSDEYQIFNAPGSVPAFAQCPWYEIKFFIGSQQTASLLKTMRYSITSVPNPNYSPGGKILTIKNSQNIPIFKSEVADCAYTVDCGDCPPGHLKLSSPDYPGYCCIPCSEVIGGIKSITAAVKGVNRG